MRDVAEEIYEWLAYQSQPKAELPLTLAMRYAPRTVTPVYLGSKLAKAFANAAVEGAFDQGNKRISGLFERTDDIARYEDSAIGSSRLI